MSFVAPILALAGTATQMFGQYTAGKAQEQAYDIQAQQIEFQGEEKIKSIEGEEKDIGSRQRAAYARSGVMNSGSALDVQLETARTFSAIVIDGNGFGF